MKPIIIAIIIVLCIVIIHLLALWMERKGWIYYWHTQGSSSRVGNAFLEIQSMLESSKKHIVEVRKEEKKEEEQKGEGEADKVPDTLDSP